MAIYQSMQRVRFRSAGDYEQFKLFLFVAAIRQPPWLMVMRTS
jgi:hypothetical protein